MLGPPRPLGVRVGPVTEGPFRQDRPTTVEGRLSGCCGRRGGRDPLPLG